MNPTGNGSLLIGYADGHVYSFRPDLGAASLLEDLTVVDSVSYADSVGTSTRSGFLFWVGGFLNNRFACWDAEGANHTGVGYWESDTATPIAPASASIESSIWDFDLPEQVKILDGFIVTCDIPQGDDTVKIDYRVDQGDWVTSLPAIDNTSTGMKTFIAVSTATPTLATTVSFTSLQFRTSINQMPDLSGHINPLEVYSVTAQARVSDFQETFEILVKLQDEEANQRTSRRQDKADVLRNFLWDTYRAKEVVSFIDGYMSDSSGRAAASGGSKAYAVTIEGIDDFIDNAGAGKARVTLRVVRGHDS
jgi:hypothetical protein